MSGLMKILESQFALYKTDQIYVEEITTYDTVQSVITSMPNLTSLLDEFRNSRVDRYDWNVQEEFRRWTTWDMYTIESCANILFRNQLGLPAPIYGNVVDAKIMWDRYKELDMSDVWNRIIAFRKTLSEKQHKLFDSWISSQPEFGYMILGATVDGSHIFPENYKEVDVGTLRILRGWTKMAGGFIADVHIARALLPLWIKKYGPEFEGWFSSTILRKHP